MGQFNIQLERFNGPLDLLLFLISKSQISIQEIFISKITEQYVNIVYSSNSIDLEEMGDFLTMAAKLIEIKSKSLLPKVVDEPDIEEEKRLLIQQLEEYKQIKSVLTMLDEMQCEASLYFTKLPEEYDLPDPTFELREGNVNSLSLAMLHILERKLYKKQKTVQQNKINTLRVEKISIKQGILNVLKKISVEPKPFQNFLENNDKEYAVTYFMAVLELLKLGRIKVKQLGVFKPISIKKGNLNE